ncbi:hypothetical protein [Microtetraspora sp. NBRC 16547]|uniref:hypothetical protein n=1 Tax=Microtetraspora sp. NBRC 16547 TaxID=3030993 RepID=UPI0024A4431D|nr:hypothetical protein [Microtetraspora sp. NBRC 16547]GLX00257.1 hypothetical protein Misp02_43430 [Microtetraspora sp. NBRC 16547]
MDELKTLIKELEHQPPQSLARQRLRLLEEARTRKPRWRRFLLPGRAARGLARTRGLSGLSGPSGLRGRRLALTGALAGMAFGASLVAPTLIGSTAPAYAVTENPDGTITVEIRNRFYIKDFNEKLETELRAFGVPAVVDVVPYGKKCKEPRARYRPWEETQDLTSWNPSPDALGFTLHRDQIKSGQTLVITYLLSDDDASSAALRYEVADGPVAACQLEADPDNL